MPNAFEKCQFCEICQLATVLANGEGQLGKKRPKKRVLHFCKKQQKSRLGVFIFLLSHKVCCCCPYRLAVSWIRANGHRLVVVVAAAAVITIIAASLSSDHSFFFKKKDKRPNQSSLTSWRHQLQSSFHS